MESESAFADILNRPNMTGQINDHNYARNVLRGGAKDPLHAFTRRPFQPGITPLQGAMMNYDRAGFEEEARIMAMLPESHRLATVASNDARHGFASIGGDLGEHGLFARNGSNTGHALGEAVAEARKALANRVARSTGGTGRLIAKATGGIEHFL